MISLLVAAIAGFATAGCAPKCAKVITTKTPEDLNYEDAVRINNFVKRRASAMKEAEGGNMYTVEDAKLTVTACEFAIHMTVRTRNLFEDGSPLYEQNLSEINETRCFLDDVLASKGKLIGKGKDAFFSGGTVKDIRAHHEKFAELFGEEGTLSERAVTDIYKNGVKAKKKGAAGENGPAVEEQGGTEEDAAAEGGEGGETGGDVFSDEGGTGETGGGSGMDSF